MSFFNFFNESSLLNKNSIFFKIKNIFNSDLDRSDFFDYLSDVLLEADVGLETTDKIINILKSSNLKSKHDIKLKFFDLLNNILYPCQINLNIDTFIEKPFVLLVCGVNGVGKTTTVVKIANLYKNFGKKVCVVAGDTYRAAAIEQLTTLCDKNFIPIFKQHYGADSASVVYDAINLSKNKKDDLLIIDTSGRLHTNNYLMKDLLKIKTCLKKVSPSAPHESLMVLDSNFGQNSINQFLEFNKYIGISGICFTKFDGSAKGGVIFNISSNFKIPIRYVTFGENIDDISFFDSKKFLEKLL